MLSALLIGAVICLTLICFGFMCYKAQSQEKLKLSFIERLKLVFSGIVAFIADTLGIGSFAVNIALARILGTFPEEEMPAVNNGAQVLPGAIESVFFMTAINVDLTTLFTLVLGTCIGGVVGGFVASKISAQHLRFAMIGAFSLIVGLLIAEKLKILPLGGELTALSDWSLVLGFFAMILCGALTSMGVGLFVLVQGVLFLMNVSPAVAFPIMTTAGAMQQPLTTLVFVQQGKIPLRKTLIISLAGVLGVAITLPFFMLLTKDTLHTLLLLIVVYNLISVCKAFWQHRIKTKRDKNELQPIRI